MKNKKIWLIQIPIILLFTFAFFVTQQSEQGNLTNHTLRHKVYPTLRSISGKFTDIKFNIRGYEPVKNKIVIVEIDQRSIDSFGRWPWHRDVTAYLVESIFLAGAKVVGLDIVFSEPDVRIPDNLAKELSDRNLDHLAKLADTDANLEKVIDLFSEKVVMGWATENPCQPAYWSFEQCPVTLKEAVASHPPLMPSFAYQHIKKPPNFDPQKTPVMSLVTFIANLPRFNAVGNNAGTFNSIADPDSLIRRTSLAILGNGIPYPTLPLEIARVGRNEELAIEFDNKQKIKAISFAKSGEKVHVDPLGVMSINFRGPSYHFPYISALDVVSDSEEVRLGFNRETVSTKSEVFKDAYVLVGLSALGVHDIRSFPFDENTPGVEGHANILDNILSNDMIIAGTDPVFVVIMFLLMIFGAITFSYIALKIEAIPALCLFLLSFFVIGFIDQKILFDNNNININTSFFYLEFFTIFFTTLAAKYILEEKNKKFIRDAFSRYVAPTVVDSIIKDPKSLTIGGEKKDLSILFSDIRGFTSFSERLDAKALAKFLNDYLGTMTDLILNNNGTFDKYIGDAIMSFWGAPLSQDEHAYNACITAIQMQKKLNENREKLKRNHGVVVNIGVGVHSGVVNVGNMGSESIFEYTVIGDHVNLASRLEGLTKYYGVGILTTRQTITSIENTNLQLPNNSYRTLDLVKVKGKKVAVELVELLSHDISKESLDGFQEARELYTKQKWNDAAKTFEEINKKIRNETNQEDGPSVNFINRCKYFLEKSPSKDWDGSWEMTSK